MLLFLFEIIELAVDGLCGAKPRVDETKAGLKGVPCFREGFLLLRFLGKEDLQAREQVRILGGKVGPVLLAQRIRELQSMVEEIVHLALFGSALLLQCLLRTDNQILIVHIGSAVKEPAQDLVLFIAVGAQELAEFALGEHDDLAELLLVHAQQLGDAAIHGGGVLKGRFAGDGERSFHGDFGDTLVFPGLGETQLAAHGAGLPVLEKVELYRGPVVGPDQVRVHHLGLSVHPAGGAEEGKGDGVKDGGLAGACIAGDEIEIVLEIRETDGGGIGVGAESGHGQGKGSHRFSTSSVWCIRSASSCAIFSCEGMACRSSVSIRAAASERSVRSCLSRLSPPVRSV